MGVTYIRTMCIEHLKRGEPPEPLLAMGLLPPHFLSISSPPLVRDHRAWSSASTPQLGRREGLKEWKPIARSSLDSKINAHISFLSPDVVTCAPTDSGEDKEICEGLGMRLVLHRSSGLLITCTYGKRDELRRGGQEMIS